MPDRLRVSRGAGHGRFTRVMARTTLAGRILRARRIGAIAGMLAGASSASTPSTPRPRRRRVRPDPTLDSRRPCCPPKAGADRSGPRYRRARRSRAIGESVSSSASPANRRPALVQFGNRHGVTIQFATPIPRQSSYRRRGAGTPDARCNTSSSGSIGTSVMRVAFAGTAAELAEALRARGFTVREAGGACRSAADGGEAAPCSRLLLPLDMRGAADPCRSCRRGEQRGHRSPARSLSPALPRRHLVGRRARESRCWRLVRSQPRGEAIDDAHSP